MDFVDNFERFLDYMNVEIIDINSDIAEQASKLRGQYTGHSRDRQVGQYYANLRSQQQDYLNTMERRVR